MDKSLIFYITGFSTLSIKPYRDRLRKVVPIPQKPRIIIAHVAGSGTALIVVVMSPIENCVCEKEPELMKPKWPDFQA